jgi:hypothetical protein
MKNIIQYRYDEIINGIFIMIITFILDYSRHSRESV